ncbi:MAG: SlyX family protein [Pseudorhodobacter sp.]|nr:SlyX family protein [Pseudorhodobacter sp.]
MERRIEAVEEKMAHVLRGLDDLSDVVAAQANEIDRLKRQVGLLLGREAGREAESGGAVVLADQKPPHW